MESNLLDSLCSDGIYVEKGTLEYHMTYIINLVWLVVDLNGRSPPGEFWRLNLRCKRVHICRPTIALEARCKSF